MNKQNMETIKLLIELVKRGVTFETTIREYNVLFPQCFITNKNKYSRFYKWIYLSVQHIGGKQITLELVDNNMWKMADHEYTTSYLLQNVDKIAKSVHGYKFYTQQEHITTFIVKYKLLNPFIFVNELICDLNKDIVGVIISQLVEMHWDSRWNIFKT